jgi:hypothetical protein
MGVTILTGDQRTREAKHWPTWLGKVPEVRRRFHAWSDNFDPFHYNETPSVAALANAATLAGFVAQTEYVLDTPLGRVTCSTAGFARSRQSMFARVDRQRRDRLIGEPSLITPDRTAMGPCT